MTFALAELVRTPDGIGRAAAVNHGSCCSTFLPCSVLLFINDLELTRGGKCQPNVTKSSFVCLMLLYLGNENISYVIIRMSRDVHGTILAPGSTQCTL
jgi:hypothetical protein